MDLVQELVTRVMKPLQSHLMDSGFDGLVWQAGLGNPVAANNFMLKSDSAARYHWVWIDLESGVPALFPMNILTLFSYYLPRCWKHRGWLFDDVDIPALRAYLAENSNSLNQALGMTVCEELSADVDALESHQKRWKSIRRHHRGIEYALSKDRLTAEKAEWFKAHPLRWYLHLARTGLKRIRARLATALANAWNWLRQRPWRRHLRQAWLFAISQRFRKHRAHLYVARRIRSWRSRRFLDLAITRRLGRELRCTEDSEYITDFAVHLFIKPLVKGFQWLVIPLLYGMGILQSEILIGFLLVSGGAIGRTAYTTGRLIQASLSGQRRPWVALGIGVLPVVGNGAYPAQLILCSNRRNQTLARFVLYDLFATIGRHLPIWGGDDTLTEHWFNRLPDRFLARRYISGLRETELYESTPSLKRVYMSKTGPRL